ncbi:MAG: hypothetical protein OHK0039_03480 [Bacteroidia bacterium]
MSQSLKPYIFLACTTQQGHGGEKHSPASVRECEHIAHTLRTLEEEGTCKVIQAWEGSGVYTEDLFFQKQIHDQVAIIHIAGPGQTESELVFPSRVKEVEIGPQIFARILRAFGGLHLVVLSGVATADLARELMAAGVPVVLSLGSAAAQSGIARDLYFHLIQGKSLHHAFEDLQAEYPGQLRQASYDPAQGQILPDEAADQPFVDGLVVHDAMRASLNWRLRNPLLIPIAERDSWKKIAPEAVAEVLHEVPNARLRRVRSDKPVRERSSSRSTRPADTGRSKPGRRRPIRKQPVAPPVEKPRWLANIRRTGLAVLGIAVAFGLISLLFPQIPRSLKKAFVSTEAPAATGCPFVEGDGRYHVLILPFQNAPACSEIRTGYQLGLLAHLRDQVQTEGLPVEVKIEEYLRACGKETDLLRDIASVCGADLIVWGSYHQDSVSNQEVVTIQYFSSNTAGEQVFIDGTGSYRRIAAASADETVAALGDNLGTLVYWALAMRRMRNGDYTAAIDIFQRIATPSEEVRTMVSLMLTQCYERSGRYAQAEAYYNQLLTMKPDDPQLYLRRAEILYQMGRFDQAVADYGYVLDHDPENQLALLGRGKLYTQRGQYDKALADFGQIIRIDAQWAPVYPERAKAFEAINRPYDALRDFEKALELRPDYAEAYYGRALLRYHRGSLAQALEDVATALRIDPDYQEALLFQGDVWSGQGKWKEAVQAYTRVIERQPSTEAYYKRAVAKRNSNLFDEAIADLERALGLNETHVASLMLRGQLYAATQKWPQALADFSQVVTQQPGHAEAYCLRGEVYTSMARPDSALMDFDHAIQLDDRNPRPYYFRSLLYLAQGAYDEAADNAAQALRIDPRSADAYLVLGRIQLARGETSQALGSFNRALQYNTKLADAYTYRGEVYMKTGRHEQAGQDFEKAIAQGSLMPAPYLFLGKILQDKGDFAGAQARFTAAIQLASDMPEAYLLRARLAMQMHDYQQARSNFDLAIGYGADDAATYTDRGRVLAALREYNLALVDFNRVLRMYPDSAAAYCTRGMLYRDMGKINQALEDFSRALKLQPDLALAQYSRGIIYQGLESYDQAITAYAEAIRLDPQYADAYNKRGEIYFLREEYDRSIMDFNQALRIDPTHARAYNNLGDLSRKAGDYARALRNYSLAIQHDPTLSEAYYHRGFIYTMQEQYDAAIADIRRSLELDPDEGLRYGFLAKIYARQREDELFYQHIELALQHDYPSVELKKDPAYKVYQEEPRFLNLLDTYQK